MYAEGREGRSQAGPKPSLLTYRLGRDRGAVDDAARNIPQRKQEYEEEQPQKRKPRRRFFHMGIFDGGFHRGLDGQRFFTLRDGGVGVWEGGWDRRVFERGVCGCLGGGCLRVGYAGV